jgi:hypothetical protein
MLIASEKSGSSVRNASFRIGSAVPLLAQPGDRLYTIRTGSGGIGLSLVRDQRLVLVIGAVTAVPLGTDVLAIQRPARIGDFDRRIRDSWLEFRVGTEQAELREREMSQIGAYSVYVEYCWRDGIPGTDECVSMCVADNQALSIAALRSAILLGRSDMKITRWDGTEMVGYSDPGFPDFTFR